MPGVTAAFVGRLAGETGPRAARAKQLIGALLDLG
jgi:hypothetical protein